MRGNPLVTALFWLMFLVGGGSLVIGLYLPPWLENHALNDQLLDVQRRVSELEARLTALDVQAEHLRTDPAYLERLARREFGIATPGRETVLIESIPLDGPPDAPADLEPVSTRARIESAIETAARTHPVVSLYVRDHTRPIVLGMSLVLMLAAVVLLGRSSPSADPDAASRP